MKGIQRSVVPTTAERMLVWVTNILAILILGAAVYFGSNFLESTLGGAAGITMAIITIAAYVYLVKLAAGHPELGVDDDSIELDSLPEVSQSWFYYGHLRLRNTHLNNQLSSQSLH